MLRTMRLKAPKSGVDKVYVNHTQMNYSAKRSFGFQQNVKYNSTGSRVSVRRAAKSADVETVPNPNPVLNALTEAIASSPLNQGKLWLAKQQAGDFDVKKVTSKVNKAINSGGVFLLNCRDV